MSVVVTTTKNKPRRRVGASAPTTSVVVTKTQAPRKKGGIQKSLRRASSGMNFSSFLSKQDDATKQCCIDYACSLCAPFCCPPVKLGWGNLGSSHVMTGTYRSTYTTTASNPDFAFTMQLAQQIQNNFTITVGQAGLITIVPLNPGTGSILLNTNAIPAYFNNTTVMAQEMEALRYVSGGIRVTPQLAMSDHPGLVFVRNTPNQNTVGWWSGQPASSLISQTEVTSTVGAYGSHAEVDWRPQEPDDFDFFPALQGLAYGQQLTRGTNPMIIFQGFPVGISFLIEAVINYEYISNANGSALNLHPFNNPKPASTPSNAGTFEQVTAGLANSGFDLGSGPSAGVKIGDATDLVKGAYDVVNTAADMANGITAARKIGGHIVGKIKPHAVGALKWLKGRM